jgi:hypothetical protein
VFFWPQAVVQKKQPRRIRTAKGDRIGFTTIPYGNGKCAAEPGQNIPFLWLPGSADVRPNAAKFLLQPDGFALEGRLAAPWPAPYLNFVRNQRSEAAAPFGVRRLVAAFPADLLPPSLQHARPIRLEPAASCRYAGQWNVTAKRRQVTA